MSEQESRPRNDAAVAFIWYAYIALLPLLGLIRAVERISADKGGFSSRYMALIFLSLLAFGVYAAVAKRVFFRRWLWLGVLRLSQLLSICALGFALYLAQDGVWQWAGASLLLALLLLPAQLQLQRYCATFNSLR